MRIIAGSLRGRKLVEWESAGIRPMRDFVRGAMFSILVDFIPNSAFLDLYCGTGSVGIEAISRGADHCVFVDRSPESCGITRRNLEALGLLDQGRVLESDAVEACRELARRGKSFDLVFIGPPYYHELVPRTLGALADGRLLSPDPVVIAEIHHKESAAESYGILELADERKYGDNRLLFYRRADSDDTQQKQGGR